LLDAIARRDVMAIDTDRSRLLAAGAAVAGVTMLDAVAATRLSQSASRRLESGSEHEAMRPGEGPIRLAAAITMRGTATELHREWRSVENLPRSDASLARGFHPARPPEQGARGEPLSSATGVRQLGRSDVRARTGA
jgi:hypothetical protein